MLSALGDAFVDGRDLGVDIVHVLLFFLAHPALRLQVFLGFRAFVISLCLGHAIHRLRAGDGREREASQNIARSKGAEAIADGTERNCTRYSSEHFCMKKLKALVPDKQCQDIVGEIRGYGSWQNRKSVARSGARRQ